MTALPNNDTLDRANQSWLDLYLSRICRSDHRRIETFDGLATIMQAHIGAFPFEMLDYFVGTPPTVDVDMILQKFLVRQRGGGCSQQNALFQTILRELGVVCSFGMARVPREDGNPSPRAHMILFVELEERSWLCDVGYGVGGPLQPILIEPGRVQQQGHHQFQVSLADGDFYALRRLSHDFWKTLYLFDHRTYDLQDFEPANYFNSLSPRSIFTRNLIVGRTTFTGGKLIRNNSFTILDGDHLSRQRIRSCEHLSELLFDHFSIPLAQSDFIHLPRAYGGLPA